MAGMRGDDRQPTAMFSYVSAEDRVPADHPLRPIRALVDEILRDMWRDFDDLYARVGRPSRRSGSCAPCCWRCSTRSGVSGC